MKFTKKITALLLAGIMTLSACNATDVVTTTGTEAPTIEATTTTEAAATTTTEAVSTTTTEVATATTSDTTTSAEETTTAATTTTTEQVTEAVTEAVTEVTTETSVQTEQSAEAADDEETAPFPGKGFNISGTKLYDANGNEFIMRGVNHAHTWFKGELHTAIPAIAETGANTVRIVLSNGHQWTKDSLDSILEIIDLCKEHKLVAVLEVHDGTGINDASVLEGIVDYWIEMKDALIGNEAYVILNIANEWYGDWGVDEWAEGYISQIPRIREAGIENLIMVDSAGWGQYPMSIAKRGADVLAADPLKNTMFSIHMYGTAGKTDKVIQRNIDNVQKQGLCVCIGEFGYNHSDGDVKEEFIMQYCTEIGVGYLGWSWKGNGGGVEYLDIAKTWDGSQLSSDWGEPLINGTNGIRETSEICSVFE